MVSAMVFVLRTGIPWRDLPGELGCWSSVYTRWRRWCAVGLWGRLLRCCQRWARGRLRFVDCSYIKLHQDGANPVGGQSAAGIGRTRAGLATKLATIAEAKGRVVALAATAGQRHDLHAVAPLERHLRGMIAVADRNFDANAWRARLHAQDTVVCVPSHRRRAVVLPHHRGHYRHRHKIENCFARLKRYRRIALRFEKLLLTFLAFVQLAAVLDWLKSRF